MCFPRSLIPCRSFASIRRLCYCLLYTSGADPSTVEVVDVEDIPMAYLGDALCIRVKAVGDLML